MIADQQGWGRTGRAALRTRTPNGSRADVVDVIADGRYVGYIQPGAEGTWHLVALTSKGYVLGVLLPDRDAAVAAVLRRAAVEVWALERGPVVPRVTLTAGGWMVECGDPDHETVRACEACRRWWQDRDTALRDAQETAVRANRHRNDRDAPSEAYLAQVRNLENLIAASLTRGEDALRDAS